MVKFPIMTLLLMVLVVKGRAKYLNKEKYIKYKKKQPTIKSCFFKSNQDENEMNIAIKFT